VRRRHFHHLLFIALSFLDRTEEPCAEADVPLTRQLREGINYEEIILRKPADTSVAFDKRMAGYSTFPTADVLPSMWNSFVVAFGALIFANFTNLAGMVDGIVSAIEYFELSPVGVVLAMCVIYLLLGCVFDSLAMLLLTIPIFVAVIEPMGVDLIWFGIVAIIIVEIGLITPPIGMNVFVVKTVLADVRIWAIFAGVWPFVVASLIGLAMSIAMPEIALLLPGLMG